MKKIILALITVLIFSSCKVYKNIEFLGIEGIKFEKIEKRNLFLNLGFKITNPNLFSIKIKPSIVNVYVNDELIGKAYLDERVKFIRRKTNIYTTKIHLELEDGDLLKFFKFSLKDKVDIHIQGEIKSSIFCISKIVEVNYSKEIDGSIFKIDK